MALLKEIATKYGESVKATYWVISEVSLYNFNKNAVIVLDGYASKEDRDNGAEKLDSIAFNEIYPEGEGYVTIDTTFFDTLQYIKETGKLTVIRDAYNTKLIEIDWILGYVYALAKTKEFFINAIDI